MRDDGGAGLRPDASQVDVVGPGENRVGVARAGADRREHPAFALAPVVVEAVERRDRVVDDGAVAGRQAGRTAEPEAPERAEIRPQVAVRRGDGDAPVGPREVATGRARVRQEGEVVGRVTGRREDARAGDTVALREGPVRVDAGRRSEPAGVAAGGPDGRVGGVGGDGAGVVRVCVCDGDVVYVDAGEGVVERRPVDAGVDEERVVAVVVEVGVHPAGRDAVARERDAAHGGESGGDDFNAVGGIRHGFEGPSRGSDHVKGREWYQADDVAAEYEEKRFSRGGRLIDRREKRAVLDVLAPVEGREVLEIACGTGRFTVALAERDAEVVGLDISAEMLAQGREKARRAGRSVEFLRGDAGRLPFPDDSFDAVFAMRFFHLADTPAAYLSEMARVAREQVFFDTFNAASARSIYNWALPMGSRLYSSGEVAGLFTDVDLELRTADHDFVLPFGFYRQVPNRVADGVRDVDLAVGRTGVGSRLASVSYWDARVTDGSGESEPF